MLTIGGMGTVAQEGGAWREVPTWCNLPGADALMSLFGSNTCTPMTNAEQRAAQEQDLRKICAGAADPQACLTGALLKSDDDVKAGTKSEALQFGKSTDQIECEQKYATERPTLSAIFGPENLCKLAAGEYNTLLLIGGGVLLLLMLRPRRY
jgi:hypothetical protein